MKIFAGTISGLILFCGLLVVAGNPYFTASAARTPAIAEEKKSNFDGPAELPRVYMKTSMADTPAPGKVRMVKSGENLQQAIDGAVCGDTIKLEAGASFDGHVKLPNKPCDDAHWIIIRTSAPDSSLPPEGTRISPCYAGVASLPGRPDFHCSNVRNAMAKITFAARGGSGPIFFSGGANHYRLLGLEVTREPSSARITALAGPQGTVAADHIIFDRVWLHGTAQDETTRGVFLAGATFIGVVDSFFSDFHCVLGGSCSDAQAIAGGSGELPMGPFKIVNNFLEASGENIIFGGGPATQTPTDIEIRHNYIYKPAIWMPGHEGFVGGTTGKPFIVKNLFEIKNAQRVLFEGNVLENSWGGVGQAGFAFMLTPKNTPPNQCPQCRLTDLTIRYCKVSHVASAMAIGNILAAGDAPAAGERYSIHDVVFEDIDGGAYKGFGLFTMLAVNAPPMRDVKIDHVTAFPPTAVMSILAGPNMISNFVFTNNLVTSGQRQIASAGGGQANCAFQPERQGASGVFKSCFSSSTIKGNAIIGGSGWPSDNLTPKDLNTAGVMGPGNGKGGDHRLCQSKSAGQCKSASQLMRAGTDGKDIGADMDAIDAATRGDI